MALDSTLCVSGEISLVTHGSHVKHIVVERLRVSGKLCGAVARGLGWWLSILHLILSLNLCQCISPVLACVFRSVQWLPYEDVLGSGGYC